MILLMLKLPVPQLLPLLLLLGNSKGARGERFGKVFSKELLKDCIYVKILMFDFIIAV